MQDDQLRELLQRAYRKDAKLTHNRVHLFAAKLRSEYRDYLRYRRFHMLIGSTPIESCDRDDFPACEVELFVRSLVQ